MCEMTSVITVTEYLKRSEKVCATKRGDCDRVHIICYVKNARLKDNWIFGSCIVLFRT